MKRSRERYSMLSSDTGYRPIASVAPSPPQQQPLQQQQQQQQLQQQYQQQQQHQYLEMEASPYSRASSISDASENPFNSKGHAEDVPQDESLTPRMFMVLVAMSFLWTASQIPLYFYGGIEPQILDSIGGFEQSTWIALGNLLPLAIVTPFVGAIADIFGRKYVGMAAFVFVMIGNVLCAVAPSMDVFIAGSVFVGIGAGFGELIALAVTGEIAPARKRGQYVAMVTFTIVPFCPAVLYAQLMASVASWRWVGLLIGSWSLVGFILTWIFYKPPPRSSRISRKELIKRIDYVGGFLSGVGLTLFLLGLTFAAQGKQWADSSVLAPLVLGIAFIAFFGIWETYLVKYPMFPARLKERNPRVLFILVLVTFVSGANFFAVLIYWPTEYQNLYATDSPVSQGIGSLPVGFGVVLGSMIGTFLVSVLKGKIRLLMVICTVVMTAANGAMACATLDNLDALWPIVTLACIGVGAVIVPSQVLAGIVCPVDLIGTITAVTISVRVIGGSIAYAVYYYIFANKYKTLVPTIIAPVAVKLGIKTEEQIGYIAEIMQGGGFGLLAEVPGVVNKTQVEALTQAGRLALSQSYPQVYYVSIAFGVISIIASLFLTGVEKEMKAGAAVAL